MRKPKLLICEECGKRFRHYHDHTFKLCGRSFVWCPGCLPRLVAELDSYLCAGIVKYARQMRAGT